MSGALTGKKRETMSEIMISGSKPSKKGTIPNIQISGAKNDVLSLMAACLLTKKNVNLINVPNIGDVDDMKKQLQSYGVDVSTGDAQSLVLNAMNARFEPVNNDNVTIKCTPGSFLVLGPLVARLREAKVPRPLGCQINKLGRPVDFHIDALVKMGAKVFQDQEHDSVWLKAQGGLHGKEIIFDKVSVGATKNVMMAACLAKGTTTITNAAVEPEVINLVNMLNNMKASIKIGKDDSGRNIITIDGQREGLLSGTTHTVIPDRIEAGSYAIACAISRGPVLLKMDEKMERNKEMLSVVVETLQHAGVQAKWMENGLQIKREGEILPVNVTSGPYPQFPTDLLPQWVTFMTLAHGKSEIEDTIYDNRFRYVTELQKLGAKLTLSESKTVCRVEGKAVLVGTCVNANDLRAGFALILAGMATTDGTTRVKGFRLVQRGYENIEEKLKQCGAKLFDVRETPGGFYGY